MAIRMTGLTSGLDTESIVAALMEAQKSKKTKVENKKTKLEWTQTIWSGLNKKLYSFYTDYAGKMRFQSSYLTKKVASSDSSVLTATAKSSAANGSYSVKVSQLAAAQYVTSAKLGTYKTTDENGKQIDTAVTSTTKFADLGFDTSGSSAIEITSGDTKVNLYVDQDTTIGDFVQKLKDAGLNASFDEKQSRFFISAKNSGADSKFTITNTALSTDQTAAKDALLQAMDYSSLSSSDQSTVKQVLSDLQNSQSADTKTAAYKSLQDIADTAARTKVTDYYSEQLKDKYTSQYITTETTTDADGHQVTVEKLTDAGRQALKDANLDNDIYTDTDRLSVVKDKLISQKVSEEITADDYKQKIESAVENGSADAGVDSKATRDSDIIVAVDNYATQISSGTGVAASSGLTKLGMDNVDGSTVKENASGSGMAVIAAADSVVQVNGATLTSSNTILDVNGLTLDLVSASDKEVKVTVSNDSSAVYDSIKDFVEQYNTILAEMNKYYYASSSKGYDPLTDDQKKEMSDDEVEKWETKIKDSLLRRDNTLGGIMQTMRSVMTSTTVTASNGKSYSLANLGITTGRDYKEYGLLHIKGDEDDEDYADSTNTLENLINEDPQVVQEVLSGIVTNLYNDLTKKMTATTMSSALTFYNDKQMTTQLTQYKKDIKSWESKLSDMEDRYYKQFTAMEKSLASLQSQKNSLASYLGG